MYVCMYNMLLLWMGKHISPSKGSYGGNVCQEPCVQHAAWLQFPERFLMAVAQSSTMFKTYYLWFQCQQYPCSLFHFCEFFLAFLNQNIVTYKESQTAYVLHMNICTVIPHIQGKQDIPACRCHVIVKLSIFGGNLK